MAPSFDATCDFHKALRELQHCLAYEAESSDAAMHTSAWVCSVYVSWHRLQLAWLSEEEGFMDDKAWWDVDLVGNSREEYEFLGNEATKSGIHIPSLPDSSVTHEFSVLESEVIASLVLPSVPTGGEQIICTPLSTGSPAFPDLPNFPVAPSHRPQGESGSEFELPNSLCLSPTACMRCMASLQVNNTDRFQDKYSLQPVPSSSELWRRVQALLPEIDVSPSKCARTTKGKKDKKDQGGSKDAPAPKKRGRPCKIRDDKPVFKCRGGLGEPIPKNAVEVAESRLQPIGLLVPDKDFGDYMQESCDACHHHPCIVHHEDSYVNTVEQVFNPLTTLADSISHDLKVLLDDTNKLLDPSTSIKCSILHQHVQALWSLAELIEQGMCLSREAEEKDHGDEESEAE
ncbi:hypothetical protein IW262DRAFT_1463078 [Armillaria fumosa]|nr:hypothetical protein IW262DRAFT_1463078 [Armillaria fumosa]